MEPYTNETRKAVDAIIKGNPDPNIENTVIVFSQSPKHSKSVSLLGPPQHVGTNIFPAFKLLHELVMTQPSPGKIIIVFISDGMDTSGLPLVLTQRLNELGKLPVNSLLLTVGVGAGFPTGLVIDALRPMYHTGDASMQPVIPVSEPDELNWAFCQLEGMLLEQTDGQNTNAVPLSIGETNSNKDLILYVQAKYNECVIKCAMTGRTSRQNYTLIYDTKVFIQAAFEIAKKRLAAERVAKVKDETSEADQKPIQPLVSNILRSTVYSTKACLTSALSAITRLNKLMDECNRGKLLSELSDEAKKELLGGNYVEGKLTLKASKYRSADLSTTKASLLRLLREYQPNEQDWALQDVINLLNQAQYFEDAKNHLQDLIPLLHTLPGILNMLAFVCRTVTFKEPLNTDVLQMNEWLAEVEALPQIISRMTTLDFIKRFNGKYTSHGETINGLLVLGGDQRSPGIFHHVQSFLLFKHPGLFCHTARLALAGSILFFLLGSHEALCPWMHNELQIVQDICSGYPRKALESWHMYVESTANPDFRICLVSESPKLPHHCKCPGLTKFILALYCASNGCLGATPQTFSVEDLKERHQATVVEFLARSRITMIQCMDFNQQDKNEKADAFLTEAWTTEVGQHTAGEEILAASLTLQEARLRFSTMVEIALANDEIMGRWTADAKLTTRTLKTARHYQLSLQRINLAFKNLASICGHGDEVSFTLTKAGLLRALQTANRLQNGYDRFSKPEPTTPLTREEICAITVRFAKDELRKAILHRVDSAAERHYITRHKEQHTDLARVIPTQHIQRFKEDFGLDIGRDWAVNAGGLSNHACCSPKCPHYLDLLNHNIAIPSDVICPRLHQHLGIGTENGPFPAFHKAVSFYTDLKYSPERVVNGVKSGACIADPQLTKANLETFKFLEESGATKMFHHKLDTLKQAKKTKILGHIIKSCEEIDLTGEDTLRSKIATLQLELSTTTWPYDDFKQVFIAKYKKHNRLLGNTPPSHPEWQQQ